MNRSSKNVSSGNTGIMPGDYMVGSVVVTAVFVLLFCVVELYF